MLNRKKIYRTLWSLISKRRKIQFGVLLLLMVISSFAEVVSIGAVIPFLAVLLSPDTLFSNSHLQPFIVFFGYTQPSQLITPLTIIFISAIIFANSLRLLLLWISTRLSYAVGSDISVDIYKRTLYQPYLVHCTRNSSEVISGITSKSDLVIFQVITPLTIIVNSTIVIIAILSALIALNPNVAILTIIIFGTIYTLILLYKKKRIKIDSVTIADESSNRIKALQEGLGGIRDVLINATQPTYFKIYRNSDLSLRRAQVNVSFTSGAPRFVVEAIGMILITLVAYSLSKGVNGISSAMPTLGAIALGAQRLLPIVQACYSSITSIRGGERTVQDAIELLSQPLPETKDMHNNNKLPFDESINLKKIDFRYNKTLPNVLTNISLKIQKNSRVGFVGPTGTGKSTLLDLVMGLLEPSKGAIEIDGEKLTKENMHLWQARISHVPQFIYLSDTSIEENIAFGIERDKIDFERVKKAAKDAQIAETIESLDKKYQTRVGESGVQLSGGQRQRIGIARALYKNSDVIIFDEATSSLDNKTERSVMNAIEGLSNKLTILIIAHRITTLKGCNQIIELIDGGIRQVDSYEELLSNYDNAN